MGGGEEKLLWTPDQFFFSIYIILNSWEVYFEGFYNDLSLYLIPDINCHALDL